jgi:hypothetical protein
LQTGPRELLNDVSGSENWASGWYGGASLPENAVTTR